VGKIEEKYNFEHPFHPDQLSGKALGFAKGSNKVLDVGCGEGADSIYYAQNGFQVLSLDKNDYFLDRFRQYVSDNNIKNIEIQSHDLLIYPYQENYFDIISCLLVGCCMKKSEFEALLVHLKKAVKSDGIIVMSLRNYMDEDKVRYQAEEKLVEPNTFAVRDDCCSTGEGGFKIRYFIEEGQLRTYFQGFEVLYYFEGMSPDKYQKTVMHGDSHIICKKLN
jgi:SAM-dependent methyltransferase